MHVLPCSLPCTSYHPYSHTPFHGDHHWLPLRAQHACAHQRIISPAHHHHQTWGHSPLRPGSVARAQGDRKGSIKGPANQPSWRKDEQEQHLTRQELSTGPLQQLPSQRLMMTVAYDGTAFAGFQLQAGKTRTVQGELEKAAGRLFMGCSRMVGASRTDAGAHAHGQVVYFDVLGSRDSLETDLMYFNAALPADVKATALQYAPPGFDAHFSCVAKTYRYVINSGLPDPLQANRSWWPHARHIERTRGPPLTPEALRLDVEAMRGAAEVLLGTRDCTALADSRRAPGRGAVVRKRPSMAKTSGVLPERTRSQNIRTLGELDISESKSEVTGAQQVVLTVSGDGFLYHMVRVLAACLLEVGAGRLQASRLAQALAAGDREALPEAAPPHGLYLTHVWYPHQAEELLGRCTHEAGRSALDQAIHQPPPSSSSIGPAQSESESPAGVPAGVLAGVPAGVPADLITGSEGASSDGETEG